jgi:hypothetical protein
LEKHKASRNNITKALAKARGIEKFYRSLLPSASNIALGGLKVEG